MQLGSRDVYALCHVVGGACALPCFTCLATSLSAFKHVLARLVCHVGRIILVFASRAPCCASRRVDHSHRPV